MSTEGDYWRDHRDHVRKAKKLAAQGMAKAAPAPRKSQDRNRGKYHVLFKDDFAVASSRLEPMGGRLMPGQHDYEAFTFTIKGLHLIFYPHQVRTTGNVHIRVRSSPTSDQKLVRRAIFLLAENSCRFQYPMDVALHNEAVSAALKEDRYGRIGQKGTSK